MSRQVQRAARRLADLNSARLRDIPDGRMFRATVTTVTAGAGRAGNPLVKVTWRGEELEAAGYPDSYTPVLGHRVFCALADAQLEILHHSI